MTTSLNSQAGGEVKNSDNNNGIMKDNAVYMVQDNDDYKDVEAVTRVQGGTAEAVNNEVRAMDLLRLKIDQQTSTQTSTTESTTTEIATEMSLSSVPT